APTESQPASLHDALPIYPEDIEGAFDELACDELCVFAESFLFPGVSLTDDRLVVVVRGKDREAIARALEGYNRCLADYKRVGGLDRKSTRLNSSHVKISY